jgi:hypothetical protein
MEAEARLECGPVVRPGVGLTPTSGSRLDRIATSRTCRRELLDHVIVFGERHLRLRRLLADYLACYNSGRVHTRLADAPDGRPPDTRPSATAKLVGLPRAGGLHHRYVEVVLVFEGLRYEIGLPG